MDINNIRRIIVKVLLDNGLQANIDYTKNDFCIIIEATYYKLKIYSTTIFTKFEIFDKISKKYLTSYYENNDNINKREFIQFLNNNLYFIMD